MGKNIIERANYDTSILLLRIGARSYKVEIV